VPTETTLLIDSMRPLKLCKPRLKVLSLLDELSKWVRQNGIEGTQSTAHEIRRSTRR